MTTLLLAEHDETALSAHTGRALTAALALGGDVHVLVAGHKGATVAEAAARLTGVRRVLLAESEALAGQLAEPLSDLLVMLAPGYDAIIAPATSRGRATLPRVAARLDVMQVSDVLAVLDRQTFQRPTYAGNAIETLRTHDPVLVLTIRTSAFPETGQGEGLAPIVPVGDVPANTLSRFVSAAPPAGGRPDLASARVVVSGGRAFGSKEQFEAVLGPLADKLGAALGATRAAVDAGYAPNEIQVGQTGKVVAPELYIACGISGAIQHIAGMKEAKVVIVINKDEQAPILKLADYALIGDVFEVLPELVNAL